MKASKTLKRFFRTKRVNQIIRSTENKMHYVNLGNTGLKVSRFSFGNWLNFNENAGSQGICDDLIKTAWENGINFFDTAETYNEGNGEKQMGISLKNLGVPRQDYVLSTKLFWGRHDPSRLNVNNAGTSRKHLTEGVNNSLKEIKTDYIDVLFCHRYDYHTPTIETVQTMGDLIKTGKILYWGTSEWPVERVMEAIFLADKLGVPRPVAEQCQYNLFHREGIEKTYTAVFDDYGYGSTIWSPLAGGVLTGKYNDGIPEDSRFGVNTQISGRLEQYFGENIKDSTINKLQNFEAIANDLGTTQGTLALAWTLINEDVSTCIIGASRPSQIEENIKSLEVADNLTPEILEKIEEIFQTRPKLEFDNITNEDLPNRR